MNFFKIISKPQNIFLIFCIIAGFFMIRLVPPFQISDESLHFFKIYGYTEGSLSFKKLNNTPGQILPKSVVQIDKTVDYLKFDTRARISKGEIEKLKRLELNKDKKEFYAFNPASYTPVSYFLLLIVLWIMKLANAAPFFMISALRFVSMFVYLALVYSAIKITPIKKNLFMLLALFPTSLNHACAVSTDGMVIGLCFLFIAYVLRLALDDEIKTLTKKDFVLFGVLITLISICKYVYLPLILIYFLIPKGKFPCAKNRLVYFWTLLFVNVIYTAYFILSIMYLTKGMIVPDQPSYLADKGQVVLFILKNPLEYLHAVAVTLFGQFYHYLSSLIGSLGWLNFHITQFSLNGYTFLLAIVILFSSSKETDKYDISLKMKSIMLLCYSICIFALITSVFIVFQCYPVIYGIQGRYLTPIVPLLCLFFYNRKLHFKGLTLTIALFSVLFLLFTMILICKRFYL